MRKWFFFVVLFSLALFRLLAERTVGISLTYSPNVEFSQRIVEGVRFDNSNYSVYLIEHGGQKILLGASYDIKSNDWLRHEFIVDSSFTYGLCGWSGLGYMFNLFLAKNSVFLNVALGTQLAVAYGPYFGKALFSLTPLCEIEAGINFRSFEALAYMSFSTPYGKEWKAIPSVGAKALVKIENSYWLGGEVFVKFAEYLANPRTMVSAFGVRILCEYQMGDNESTKRAEL